MMNLKLLTIATALAMATASPTFAMGPHARSEAVQQRLQQSRTYQYYRPDRFWPGEMAVGVIGGAVGTASAIAGAPLGYDPYNDDYDHRFGW